MALFEADVPHVIWSNHWGYAAARRMQECAAAGLTLIETFWNFFGGKNGAKSWKRGKNGTKKGWVIVVCSSN